ASAPTRAGNRRSHLPHGPHFHGSVVLEDGASARQLDGLVDARGADEEIPADQILRLGERSVGHDLLAPADELSAAPQRIAGLEVPGLAERLDPRAPLLHVLLQLLRARVAAVAAAEQIEEV